VKKQEPVAFKSPRGVKPKKQETAMETLSPLFVEQEKSPERISELCTVNSLLRQVLLDQ
jgi:hypothetical protein